MRFAIATLDSYQGVFEAFVAAGWTPLRLFTVPIRNALDSHENVLNLAEKHRAKIQLSRMTQHDLRELQDQGCEALIVASYNWKIDDWRPYLKYAVNFHPSPLPEARGPYPLVRAIMEQRNSWTITCHRLMPDIDRGEILAAENFAMQPDETHETLRLKLQIASTRLARHIAPEFTKLWDAATPQGEGSYWPRWNNLDRLINFALPVKNILCHVRAFGDLESLVLMDNHLLLSIKRAVGWQDSHHLTPGHIVSSSNRTLVIAASDGYIGLLDWQFAPPDVLADLQARLAAAGATRPQTISNQEQFA